MRHAQWINLTNNAMTTRFLSLNFRTGGFRYYFGLVNIACPGAHLPPGQAAGRQGCAVAAP